MSNLECNLKKGVIANTDRIVGIDSAGLVRGDDSLLRGFGSYSQDGPDFTHYFRGLISNVTKDSIHDCDIRDYCLSLKSFFFWTGASKIPWSFVCRNGKKCKFMIVHDGKSWSSIQSDSSYSHASGESSKAFNVRYSRHSDPPKLTFTFVSFGPSERQVFFNEVLAAFKIQMLNGNSGGYVPFQVQRICQFSQNGIPEGIFSFSSNKTKF
ncbi:hypothetical protein DSO57_1018800 [Entomophthora muscae]|uniref:Uncharacterized protein n=1 Tax=Entomophthora muscae TaxID=34485 RepID=A0ACC2T415_9FUNG|nr:hypothetical protein DSO57_1018800 [Entomophthora muscae]